MRVHEIKTCVINWLTIMLGGYSVIGRSPVFHLHLYHTPLVALEASCPSSRTRLQKLWHRTMLRDKKHYVKPKPMCLYTLYTTMI